MTTAMFADDKFIGHAGRDCGEHRTVGAHRAWCYDCSEWCYPALEAACVRCEVPSLRREIDEMRTILAALAFKNGAKIVIPRRVLTAAPTEVVTWTNPATDELVIAVEAAAPPDETEHTRSYPRDPECVAAWPGCYEGGYDPRCCRFPKSCSCDEITSLLPSPRA